jgi:hypothetical protein
MVLNGQFADCKVFMSHKPKILSLAEGGTNISLTASNGGILYSTATELAILSATATANQMLMSGASGAPTWSTATFPTTAGTAGKILISDGTNFVSSAPTYPNTATANKIFRANGTNWVASTSSYANTNAVNTIIYSNGANNVQSLATANSSVLKTSVAGVPTWLTTLSIAAAITSGTTLTATAGAITATAGNIVPTIGDINLPSTSSTVGNVNINSQRILHSYVSNSNIFLGTIAANYTLTGTNNSCVGRSSMAALTSGSKNSCLGDLSLQSITQGNENVSMGYASLNAVTTGSNNCSVGRQSLTQLTTGSYNSHFGQPLSITYTSSESSNILIANSGTAAESNKLRIGVAGTGNGQVSKCYIAAINGVTVTGNALLCSTAGQLGTVSSSIRYKENVEDLGGESSGIMNLRPVKFNFNFDKEKKIRYGLIAEEVEKTFEYLTFYNDEKQPESVLYHEIPILLLNELIKMKNRILNLKQM